MREDVRMHRPPRAMLGIALLLSATCGLAHAQASVSVTVCELVRNPEKYSNQIVRVRARATLEFEDFSLDTEDCGSDLRSIWLMYGGDGPTPTKSTVNDNEREAGSVVTVKGNPVPLVRDASLKLFRERLYAERHRGEGNLVCDEDCHLYTVTATFMGLFEAAPTEDFRGYGHMWCCHLLAIEQVSEVDPKRTAVPAGGQFACTKEEWKMEASEAQTFLRRPCLDSEDCRRAIGEQKIRIAQHWGDKIDLEQGVQSVWNYSYRWRSPDLLKTYDLDFQHDSSAHKSNQITGATATRTICEPASPPNQSAAP